VLTPTHRLLRYYQSVTCFVNLGLQERLDWFLVGLSVSALRGNWRIVAIDFCSRSVGAEAGRAYNPRCSWASVWKRVEPTAGGRWQSPSDPVFQLSLM